MNAFTPASADLRARAHARAQIFARLCDLSVALLTVRALHEVLALNSLGYEPVEKMARFLDDAAGFAQTCQEEADANGHALAGTPPPQPSITWLLDEEESWYEPPPFDFTVRPEDVRWARGPLSRRGS